MDDPSRCSVSRLARSHLPIFLPWQREMKLITAPFHSEALEKGIVPWKPVSPFGGHAVFTLPCLARLEATAGRDVQGHSSANSITSEHFSGHLGVLAGNAAVKVGVTASYDQKMDEMTNESRASHNTRLRCGSVILAEDPPLSPEARALLQLKDGPRLFSDRYGDYFVSGYILGADAGGCLSASKSDKSETESVTTTMEVEVLWEQYSESTSTTDHRQTSTMHLAFSGYDTLDGSHISLRAAQGESTEPIRSAVNSCMAKVNALQTRLENRVDGKGIKDGERLTVGRSCEMIAAGLVTELILMPFKTLKGYIQCVCQDEELNRVDGVILDDSMGQSLSQAAS